MCYAFHWLATVSEVVVARVRGYLYKTLVPWHVLADKSYQSRRSLNEVKHHQLCRETRLGSPAITFMA